MHLDDRLQWVGNTRALYKKCQSLLYFLQRLRGFKVCNKMLQMFSQSVVANTIFCTAVRSGQSVKTRYAKKKLIKLVRKASSVYHTI